MTFPFDELFDVVILLIKCVPNHKRTVSRSAPTAGFAPSRLAPNQKAISPHLRLRNEEETVFDGINC